MNINEISELKESLLSEVMNYPALLPDGNRDQDVDKIIAIIGRWYAEEVRQKLPVNLPPDA